MKKILFISLLIVMIMKSNVFSDGPVTLKFATVEPPMSLNNKAVWEPLFNEMNKEAEGILKIELYQGGSLGRNPTQYLQMLKTGVVDMVHIINPYFPGQLVDDWIVNIPLIAKDCFECTMALHHMQNKKLLSGYEDLIILGQACVGQYYIHTSFPVRTPSDLKGVKLRTAGKLHHQLAKALGAAPVAIPVTDVTEAISRGVVGGTLQDWTGMEVFRINDVATHHLNLALGSNAITVVMRKTKYNSLPENIRVILDKYKGDFFTRYWAEKENEGIKRIEQKILNNPKHVIYTPNPDEMKQWKEVIKPVIDSWINSTPRGNELLKGFDGGVNQSRLMK
jgi:TRAP-type C4-dicarboxylate transport system substrate-binding protein